MSFVLTVHFLLGFIGGAGGSLLLAGLYASFHVSRVDRAVARSEVVTDKARDVSEQARRVSLHVSGQYEPMRARLEILERGEYPKMQEVEKEIRDLWQQVQDLK